MKVEINVIKDRRMILKMDKSNNGIFEKINKIDYFLVSLIKIKGGSYRWLILEIKGGFWLFC